MINLTPLDIFRLYFHAKNVKDSETIYNLYIKGEKYFTPSKEEYYGDPEFFGANFTDNDEKLYDELQQIEEFKVKYIDENEAAITWETSNQSLNAFRLIKDTNQDVWKVSWLPMQ
ncbi:hypothetical protein [Salirhabdus salicampi]|uniref:hypothetical protein n=1 Tax=Salirhabdus salicampi TaxID=476102 RepID=UPI0020C3A467|nr:hypothetical protein [Salirhabdus salicampi]MCP8615980.1 hypothetical protein [Salirhabdus salicampi]